MARQIEGLPKHAERTQRMDALTSPSHRDALRLAAQAGDAGVTSGLLVKKLKGTRAHMLKILNDLEAGGFVQGDPAPGERRGGVATVYRIVPGVVEAAIDELRAWVTGK